MKPMKLKIMGLNSFNEEQEIDFSILTEKGFFGIFGPTGSGKSTILDAITIALYGEISRSSKNKPEFINSYRSDMNVYYEFEIGSKASRKKYSIERHYKRKKDGGTACDRAVLSDISSDEKLILAEGAKDVTDSVTSLIGLKCDDFTRSVVLPQGRFSEFLKLTKGDRGKMLERILNLEEFGSKIAFKVKGEIAAKKSQLDTIYGAMSRYEGLSTEKYEELKQKVIETDAKIEKLKSEKAELSLRYDKYNAVWQQQQELKAFEDRKQMLIVRTEEIEHKRDVVKKGKAAIIVKPYIDNYVDTTHKINLSEQKLSGINEQYSILSRIFKQTKEDYTKAYQLKEQQLPQLIEKEARLNEAVKLDENIAKLEAQILTLRQEYAGIKKQSVIIEENIKNNQEEKEQILVKIDELACKQQNDAITSEYREKVHSAVAREREYNDNTVKLQELNLKKQELGAHLVKNKTIYEELTSKKNKLENELIILKQNKEAADKALTECNEGILVKTSDMLEKSNIYAYAKEINTSVDILKNEIVEAEKKKGKAEGELEEIVVHSNKLQEELIHAEDKLKYYEKLDMAGHLAVSVLEGEACPVCGSIHHPNMAALINSDETIRCKNELERIKAEYDNIKHTYDTLAIERGRLISEIDLKKKTLSELLIKLNGITIEEYEQTKIKSEAELQVFKLSASKYETEVKKLELQLAKLSENASSANAEYIRMAAILDKDNQILQEISSEANVLSNKVLEQQIGYEKIKQELGVSSITKEYDRITKLLRDAEENRKTEQKLRSRIVELDNLRNELENKKAVVNTNLEKVRVSGEEKSSQKNEFVGKRNEYSENRKPDEYLREIKKQLEQVKNNETKLKQLFDEQNNMLVKLGEEKATESNNLITLKDNRIKYEERLNEVLALNEFEDYRMAQEALLEDSSLNELSSEILEYDNEVRSIIDNIVRLTKKLDGKTIDEAEFNKLMEDRQQNEVMLEDVTKLKAEGQRDIVAMEKDFEEIKKLEKTKKEQEKEKALLDDIMDLISGNKFVEFAASNQLKYISIEASKRLGAITRGRYALELDSSNEFVMRDDFNGGIRRSSDTLSGGETFLTSLCLALSLSSNIQLKGSAPLEFFFLDEGFGTLDTELLEVVISSLERLRNDRLCVGIISHVEELKSRVPVKLLLQPATIEGAGSKIEIEYS